MYDADAKDEFAILTIDGSRASAARPDETWDNLMAKKDYSMDPTREAKQILTVMMLLAECDALIGTRHSTFSYVAQALRSRRQARIYDEWGNGPLAAGAPMPPRHGCF